MIPRDRKEWLVENQTSVADGVPILAVLEPFPIGLQKVVAVLIRGPNEIHHVSGVEEIGGLRFMGQ